MSTTIAVSVAPAEQLEAGLASLHDLARQLFAGAFTPTGRVSELPQWPTRPAVPTWPAPGTRVRKSGVALLLGIVVAPHTLALTSLVLGSPARPSLAPTVSVGSDVGIPQSRVLGP